MLTIRAMAGGEGYAQRHLQQSDYYDQKRTVEGQWHGRGAELLGLSGKVTSEDFELLRQGSILPRANFSGSAKAPIASPPMAPSKARHGLCMT